jgi:hypothetical protein
MVAREKSIGFTYHIEEPTRDHGRPAQTFTLLLLQIIQNLILDREWWRQELDIAMVWRMPELAGKETSHASLDRGINQSPLRSCAAE